MEGRSPPNTNLEGEISPDSELEKETLPNLKLEGDTPMAEEMTEKMAPEQESFAPVQQSSTSQPGKGKVAKVRDKEPDGGEEALQLSGHEPCPWTLQEEDKNHQGVHQPQARGAQHPQGGSIQHGDEPCKET